MRSSRNGSTGGSVPSVDGDNDDDDDSGGGGAGYEPILDAMIPTQLVAYIRRTIIRWLDS
jgi:hypothetical protein